MQKTSLFLQDLVVRHTLLQNVKLMQNDFFHCCICIVVWLLDAKDLISPAPKVVTYRAAHARSMLLENQALEPNARLWVYSYVYDHLDACACT